MKIKVWKNPIKKLSSDTVFIEIKEYDVDTSSFETIGDFITFAARRIHGYWEFSDINHALAYWADRSPDNAD